MVDWQAWVGRSYHGRAAELAGRAAVPVAGGAGRAAVGGVRREGPGLDEVLEDGHEEEERDEDGRGREPEGDGVHGRAEVLERGRLAPPVRGRRHRRGWLGRRGRGVPWPRPRPLPEPAHGCSTGARVFLCDQTSINLPAIFTLLSNEPC